MTFTNKELHYLLSHVHQELDELLNADFDVNKDDIKAMHSLAAKLISMIKPDTESEKPPEDNSRFVKTRNVPPLFTD